MKKESFVTKIESVVELDLECNMYLDPELYTGKYARISYHYAKEILAYLLIKREAMYQSYKLNYGKKKAFPFLFETNAKMIMKKFNITNEAATKIIKFLNDTGAWKPIETKHGNTVYQLGKRHKCRGYRHKFLFTPDNKKTQRFYEQESRRKN